MMNKVLSLAVVALLMASTMTLVGCSKPAATQPTEVEVENNTEAPAAGEAPATGEQGAMTPEEQKSGEAANEAASAAREGAMKASEATKEGAMKANEAAKEGAMKAGEATEKAADAHEGAH